MVQSFYAVLWKLPLPSKRIVLPDSIPLTRSSGWANAAPCAAEMSEEIGFVRGGRMKLRPPTTGVPFARRIVSPGRKRRRAARKFLVECGGGGHRSRSFSSEWGERRDG